MDFEAAPKKCQTLLRRNSSSLFMKPFFQLL
ncbi:MAG: hypothetical protein ACI8ZM_004709, partial [Crocinitomix sp.]